VNTSYRTTGLCRRGEAEKSKKIRRGFDTTVGLHLAEPTFPIFGGWILWRLCVRCRCVTVETVQVARLALLEFQHFFVEIMMMIDVFAER
jgi:hypothetical protein